MEKIVVEWSGPYNVDSAIERFRDLEDFGIYLITRKWGERERLLYIGLVYRRSFADRIAEHERDWLWGLRGKVRVRMGRIRLPKGKKHSYERARDVGNSELLRSGDVFNQYRKERAFK